ncbi:MAG: Uncharacterized protein JWR32_829 [Mycobacterium sp.]|nr:Uncharacterized protein [Mycobacterium sp.]
MVVDWESLEGSFGLPDPDDEHVLVAAVVDGASAMVTHNLSDFPRANLPAHIHILAPEVFAADTVSLSPDVALRAMTAMAARYRAPGRSVDEVLNELATRYGIERLSTPFGPSCERRTHGAGGMRRGAETRAEDDRAQTAITVHRPRLPLPLTRSSQRPYDSVAFIQFVWFVFPMLIPRHPEPRPPAISYRIGL